MRHVISLLIENESGALSRVSGLFSARGYNIESLTVAPTEDLSMSRMTIVTTGTDEINEQITKQLNKLVEVVKVVDRRLMAKEVSKPVESLAIKLDGAIFIRLQLCDSVHQKFAQKHLWFLPAVRPCRVPSAATESAPCHNQNDVLANGEQTYKLHPVR